jgi:phosphopantothenoylcysteine decarboxylase/phosphopantothenate--cysteine ligase
MLLAVDIGNTNVTLGIVEGGALVATRRAGTHRAATADELERDLEGLLALDGRRLSDVDAMVVASVVPPLTAAVEAVAGRRRIPILVANAGSVPIAIRVDRPGEVGADRIVNALAAARLYGTPAVVVDFGTATTLDCVGLDGAYVGGAIAPGLELGLEALAARTAKLPRIELRTPDRAIGRDTVARCRGRCSTTSAGIGLLARVRAELRSRRGRARRIQPDPHRRLSAAPWARPTSRRGRHRPRPHAQGPRDRPRGGRRRRAVRRRAPLLRGEPPVTGGRLAGRLIGLGVCGSIAAYKAVELVRLLRVEGAEVVVMLTPAAAQFVGPLTFAALSGHAVETDVLGLLPDERIGHIVVADASDAIVVAPATARWLGAMANGIASDTVVAACLATSAPVVFAPAMDGDMWTHAATRDNVERLQRDFGYRMVPPEIGSLASGQSGIGRLAELPLIVDAVVEAVAGRPVRQPDAALRPPSTAPVRDADLEGRHVVVSAGGTVEAIDPVRFIGNRSTGKMGVAIAEAALARGARVTLVAGRVEVPLPAAARVVYAESTAAMRDAVIDAVIDHPADALVMAAAVADFRPRATAATKLTRGESLTLELEPTEDILAAVAAHARDLGPARPVLVAFAAETGSLERAPDKLRRKGADLLVANDVAEPGSGFGTDTNRVSILAADGSREDLPLLAKREVADRLLDRVVAAMDERDAHAHTGRTSTEIHR